MKSRNWKCGVAAFAILCTGSVTQAAWRSATSLPGEDTAAIHLPATFSAPASSPTPIIFQQNDEAVSARVAKPLLAVAAQIGPQEALLAAMAVCGLTAIHLRRRWG
jgi:hypothetical protein